MQGRKGKEATVFSSSHSNTGGPSQCNKKKERRSPQTGEGEAKLFLFSNGKTVWVENPEESTDQI